MVSAVIRSALEARSSAGDGRMLAIRRADNGEWVLPGGIVELDGDPRDTVRREVLEETGVAVEPGQLTGVYKTCALASCPWYSAVGHCQVRHVRPKRLPK
jgi:8-oxo-dGTP pyrophosphatase MutT (NUDIX family)